MLLTFSALFVAFFVQIANCHVRFLCPPPRSCFYGISLSNTNGDGIWRDNPCGHSPISPTTIVKSGTTLCLRVYEFVPHPGYFQISISPEAIGPNDDDSSFITLENYINDTTDDSTDTGIQAFVVTLPSNLTCDHCTIQLKQYAEDLDWYYYTCTDIKIIESNSSSLSSNMTGDTGGLIKGDLCYGNNEDGSESDWSDECVWVSETNLVRIMILQSIILGSVGTFNALIIVVAFIYVTKCCKCCRKSDDGSNSNSGHMHESKKEYMKGLWQRYLKLWIILIIFVILSFVITGIIIVLLKNCDIAQDYGDVVV